LTIGIHSSINRIKKTWQYCGNALIASLRTVWKITQTFSFLIKQSYKNECETFGP